MMDAGGEQTAVTIESVEEDPASTGGDVFLHHFVIKDDSGNPKEFCSPDAQGRSLGFPVPDGNGGFELTCTSGAIGKCIRWGYRLWEEKPGGPPLRAMHEACVHMARADYGGDGATHTRDGTLIFFCDRFGIHSCDGEAEGDMSFEAAWGTNGAVCVARPRIAELVTLQALAEKYPKLAPHVGPDVCTLEIAMQNPRRSCSTSRRSELVTSECALMGAGKTTSRRLSVAAIALIRIAADAFQVKMTQILARLVISDDCNTALEATCTVSLPRFNRKLILPPSS